MVKIVHVDKNLDDNGVITALAIKTKFIDNGDERILNGHELIATVSAAFHTTTLLTDDGKELIIIPNLKRDNVVDLIIKFNENTLSPLDIAKFEIAFQESLDNTQLFF